MIPLQNSSDLGRIIRHLRKQARLSQEALAELADVSRTAIQSLEYGKETCQLDTLFKILTVLNLTLYGDHPLLREAEK